MATAMARTSISVPDGLIEQFDREMVNRKAADELPMDVNRSELIGELMEGWIEGNFEPVMTNTPARTIPAD